MPIESQITKADEWFTATTVQLVFPIYEDDDITPIAQSMAGWTFSWLFKRDIDDLDADALITKTGGSVFVGTDPDLSIPAVFVQLENEDTEDIEWLENQTILTGYHELKRIDSGFETILSYGKARLRRAVHNV